MMSKKTVIIQRLIPDYRVPLFRKLNDRFGWRVACAANHPGGTYLNVDGERHDFADYFDCRFPNPDNQYRCDFPLSEVIDNFHPDRIIGEFSMQNNLGRDLQKLRAAKQIESYALWSHGWNMERGFGLPLDWARQYARLLPMARADLLLTYSGEGRDWLKKWLPGKKVITLGNTLDVEGIRAVSVPVEAVRFGNPQLLSVGRLTEDKKIAQLVGMFAKLKQDFPDAALTIIGDGPERARVEAEAAKLPGGSVRLLGALHTETDLARHFKGADYFVLLGAAGLSVNHALAYDLPVVCFARGREMPRHHPEICNVVDGVTGLLCSSPEHVAMLAMLNDAIAKNMSEQLRPSIRSYVDTSARMSSMIDQFAIVDRAF